MSEYRPEHLNRLEPAYMARLQLHSAPFSANHDDRFLYLDLDRSEKLKLLQHMTQFSNLLLMVMGPTGVGKTSLLQRFAIQAQPEWRIGQITAHTMMDVEQLLLAIAQGYDLPQPPHDARQLQDKLYAHLASFHRQEHVPILIIDEAHALPKEALQAVFNLADAQVEHGNLIRIILSCEPQIEKILQSKEVRALRERVTHTMVINPLSEEATAEYLKHRLAVAGFSGISPFTPRAIRKIYKSAAGLPAQINEQAHQLLLQSAGTVDEFSFDDYPVVGGRHRYKIMLGFTVGVLFILAGLFYQDEINRLFQDDPEQVQLTAPADSVTPSTPDAEPVAKIIPLIPPEPPAQTVAPPSPDSASIPAATLPEQVTPTMPPEASPPTAKKEPPLRLTAVKPEQVPLGSTAQTLSLMGEGLTPDSRVVVAWTGHEKVLSQEQVNWISAQQIDFTVRVGTQPDTWQVYVQHPNYGKTPALTFVAGKLPEAQQTATVAAETPSAGAPSGNAWARQQNPQHYTLQLFSSLTEAGAHEFIDEHNLSKDAVVVHSLSRGKDWYSVVYGVYANVQAVQHAQAQLPSAIQKLKPWQRRFDSLQAVLVKNGQAASSKATSKSTAPIAATTPKPIAAKPTAAPADSNLVQNEAWLWSQDPRHFTLQLLVSQSTDNVERFINSHSVLRQQAMYYRSRSTGRELYTLVYGVYATQEQAERAIEQLPEALRKVNPHVRRYATIHAEMDRSTQTR